MTERKHPMTACPSISPALPPELALDGEGGDHD